MIIGYVRQENRDKFNDFNINWVDDHSLNTKMKLLTKDETVDYTYPDLIYIEDEENKDDLISQLKECGAKRLVMKTPTNQNWTLKKLITEIEKDHQYFELRDELIQQLRGRHSLQAKQFLDEIENKQVSIHRLRQIQYKVKEHKL